MSCKYMIIQYLGSANAKRASGAFRPTKTARDEKFNEGVVVG